MRFLRVDAFSPDKGIVAMVLNKRYVTRIVPNTGQAPKEYRSVILYLLPEDNRIIQLCVKTPIDSIVTALNGVGIPYGPKSYIN
jgi:hypothetical protein